MPCSHPTLLLTQSSFITMRSQAHPQLLQPLAQGQHIALARPAEVPAPQLQTSTQTALSEDIACTDTAVACRPCIFGVAGRAYVTAE